MVQNKRSDLRLKVIENLHNEESKKEATVEALSYSGMFEKEIAALTEIPLEEVKNYVKKMNTDYQRYCEALVKGFDDLTRQIEVPITKVNREENLYKIAWDKLKAMLSGIPIDGWGNRDKEFITALCSKMNEMEEEFITNKADK